MSKAMPKEMDKAIREVLNRLLDETSGAFSSSIRKSDFDTQGRLAVDHLIDLDVLQLAGREYVMPDMIRVTAYGREYWERINTPAPWYWFKQNWFGAIVAAATIAASVGGIVVNALD